MKNTPIVMVASDRIDYFTQSINSIYKQAKKREFYCIIDYCDSNKIQDEHQKILLQKIPHAHVKMRNYNFGCGKNMIDCRRWIFNSGYSQSFILEDDIVVSSTYFDFCENLLKFCSDNYDNIGIVQGSSEELIQDKDKDRLKYVIKNTNNHWWGYLITKKCWDIISEDLFFYENSFLNTVYTSRPHRLISEYQNTLYNSKKPNEHERPCPHRCDFDTKIRNQFVTGQDSINAYSFYKNNLLRICPVVSRSKNIGKKGVHFNETVYNTMSLDKIIPFEDSDLNTEFTFEQAY